MNRAQRRQQGPIPSLDIFQQGPPALPDTPDLSAEARRVLEELVAGRVDSDTWRGLDPLESWALVEHFDAWTARYQAQCDAAIVAGEDLARRTPQGQVATRLRASVGQMRAARAQLAGFRARMRELNGEGA